jgi:hypothetical protein
LLSFDEGEVDHLPMGQGGGDRSSSDVIIFIADDFALKSKSTHLLAVVKSSTSVTMKAMK